MMERKAMERCLLQMVADILPGKYLLTAIYAEVYAVLVETIKELKSENDRLKSENENVNTRLEKLEAMMEYKAEK